MKLFPARYFTFFAILACVLATAPSGIAQTPGQNVNMVSGTSLPGGDPFLQRQNEPSIGVSTRNPLHLLAGANDYRSVNIPFVDPVPGSMAGDAWLGVFKSFDGGQTWQSTLLPGYPQDPACLDPNTALRPPLCGQGAAADPTIRPGTNGLFFYSGIAFNRTSNLGVVFVARFIDLNNKENGNVAAGTDPIAYVNTVVVDSGTSGQFLDKTWVVADIPRPGAGTCTINAAGTTQSFAAGNVYLVWSRFTGSSSTKIMISRSTDCGATWSLPTKLSESNSLNQGTNIAIDPATGDLYVTWRRFATKSQGDAIMFAKSTDGGQRFSKAQEVAGIIPFDQGTTPGSFRTNALPTIAISVDNLGVSRAHIAWAGRPSTTGDARIMMSTSHDGGRNWTTPAAVDDQQILDDFPLNDPPAGFTRGHQFMPQLTFVVDKLMVLYYDTRLDHTIGTYTPNSNPETGCILCPDEEGNFYKEDRNPWGEFGALSSFVNDPVMPPPIKRRTIDLRVAQADPKPLPGEMGPKFQRSVRVSQYIFGSIDGSATLQQLKLNPPNLPMFVGGTMPFIGDYIDLAGLAFLPPETPGGNWRYNIGPGASAYAYAVWTSNEDVRPPSSIDPAKRTWANFTPPDSPDCDPGQVGIRNQNIYSSRITQGLLVSSPQNSKPLSTDVQRAFVILVQNQTGIPRSFQMSIANQPPGGYASFTEPPFNGSNPLKTTLNVDIPAHSGVTRSVYAKSGSNSEQDKRTRIVVNVDEIVSQGSGLSSFVLLNGDPTAPVFADQGYVDPDGYNGTSVNLAEIYNPNISNPNISNPNISNPNISNPNISNPNISNPNISNLEIADPNISNPNISNPNISNPNISNPNISNATLVDVTYQVQNNGNTSASYTINLAGNTPPGTSNSQLIINKPYLTPTFGQSNGFPTCQLVQQSQNNLLTNVTDPVFQTVTEASTPDQFKNPNISNPNISNATFMLAPGETALVTVRSKVENSAMQSLAAASVNNGTSMTEELTSTFAPLVISQSNNTNGSTDNFDLPIFISTTSADLPQGTVGQLPVYDKQLMRFGGREPFTWSLVSGNLGASGLTLLNDGHISGTPIIAGTFNFVVRVTDSSALPCPTEDEPTKLCPRTNIRSLSITVVEAATMITLTDDPDPTVTGQPYTVSWTVTGDPAGSIAPSGTVTVDDGTGISCSGAAPSGSCTLTSKAEGTQPRTLTANYSGEAGRFQPRSKTESHQVNKADTTIVILSVVPNLIPLGQSVTVNYTVSVVSPGSGTPTGMVTVTDGTASAQCPVGAGSCLLTPTSSGLKTATASYAGDANYKSSSTANGVEFRVGYIFQGFLSPMSVAGTCSDLTPSGVQKLGNALPIKWKLLDSNGAPITLDPKDTIVILEAIKGTSCTPSNPNDRIVLYNSTSGAKGGSEMRLSTDQYIFNWNTGDGTAAGMYVLVLTLQDGSVHATTIELKP